MNGFLIRTGSDRRTACGQARTSNANRDRAQDRESRRDARIDRPVPSGRAKACSNSLPPRHRREQGPPRAKSRFDPIPIGYARQSLPHISRPTIEIGLNGSAASGPARAQVCRLRMGPGEVKFVARPKIHVFRATAGSTRLSSCGCLVRFNERAAEGAANEQRRGFAAGGQRRSR